eukprot:gene35844-43474_t
MLFILLILLVSLNFASAIQGEIISCSRCKLNSLPEVRRFLKEPGHADAYQNLKVTFIFGRNPDLHIKDEQGNTIETIDLSPLKTEEIHKLMARKGFERKAAGTSGVGVSAETRQQPQLRGTNP